MLRARYSMRTAGRMTFEMLGADMSRSADLSYSYGKYSNVRRKGTEARSLFSDLADG